MLPENQSEKLDRLKRRLEDMREAEKEKLRRMVETFKDHSRLLETVSAGEKNELSNKLSDLKRDLSEAKGEIEKQRYAVVRELGRITEEVLRLEPESASSLVQAEIEGLIIFEERNRLELHRLEALLDILSAADFP